MPYKRRLRVLFVSDTDGRLLQLAVDIEAQGAGLPLSAELIDWADLILTLDTAARQGLPRLPARAQVRHVDIAPQAEPDHVRDALEARIRGILGGLRLMERSERRVSRSARAG